jgi:hypothetical protein
LETLLLENKWLFLIGAEVSFWVLSGAFLVLRYWFGSDRGSLVLLALIVVDNVFILALGALDYLRTGEFAAYQIVIAAVLVYGLTFGKKDFKRLDAYLQRKVMAWKWRTPPPAASEKKTSREKARSERSGWYKHLAVFAVGQAILFAMGESWISARLGGQLTADPSGLMMASLVWTVVFVVDTIWSLSYTVFPVRDGSGQRIR